MQPHVPAAQAVFLPSTPDLHASQLYIRRPPAALVLLSRLANSNRRFRRTLLPVPQMNCGISMTCCTVAVADLLLQCRACRHLISGAQCDVICHPYTQTLPYAQSLFSNPVVLSLRSLCAYDQHRRHHHINWSCCQRAPAVGTA